VVSSESLSCSSLRFGGLGARSLLLIFSGLCGSSDKFSAVGVTLVAAAVAVAAVDGDDGFVGFVLEAF